MSKERLTGDPMTTMECTWPENISGIRKRLIDNLLLGRTRTLQLNTILRNLDGRHQLPSAQELVAEISRSFNDALSTLSSGESDEALSQIPASSQLYSPGWDGRKSEESGESSKSSTKDRRGCYKRRKTMQSWMTITASYQDDGHAWRKYGQKMILNAKHQRSYYRCTHKHDQGCMATKQVQMTEDEPPQFRTTYHGLHTCKSVLKPTQILLDTASATDKSFLLSFQSISQDNGDSFFPFPSIKREEEIPSDDQEATTHPNAIPAAAAAAATTTTTTNNSSSSDYLLSPGLTTFESHLGSDHGDVLSRVNSSGTDSAHSFDGLILDLDEDYFMSLC